MRKVIFLVSVAVLSGCVYSDECTNGAERIDGKCSSATGGSGGSSATGGSGGSSATGGSGGSSATGGSGGSSATGGSGGSGGSDLDGGLDGGEDSGADTGVDASVPDNPIVQVALATQHVCVRRQGGEVFCRGDNTRGQLGQGDYSTPPGAVQVTLPAPAIDLSGSAFHTCAALSNGEIYCWGANDNGVIGDGTTDDTTSPTLAGMGQRVIGGFANSCLLRSQAAYCWGRNDNGQVGIDHNITDSVLNVAGTPVTRDGTNRVENVVEVTLGDRTTCLRDLPGKVWCLGANDARQFGAIGFPESSFVAVDVGLTGVRSLGGTQQTWCAALTDGTVECWGANDMGQAGFPSSISPALRKEVSGVSNVVQVGVGYATACARRMDGSVICWGDNSTGQLGQGDTDMRAVAVVVPGVTASSINVGLGGNTCAIVDGGSRVLCWGGGVSGTAVSTPVELVFD